MANQYIKRANIQDEYDLDKVEELEKCTNDPIYFIKTYVKIQHPVKGTVPFHLYEYQEEMIDIIHNNKDVLLLASRQLGKCVSSETLINIYTKPKNWFKILLLKILDKELYAKKSFFSRLKNKILRYCLDKQEISIEQFHNLNNPITVAINDYEGNLKFIQQTSINNCYVDTPLGLSKIKSSFKTVKYKLYEVILENGLYLKGADNHIVIDKDNKELFLKDLNSNTYLKTIKGISKVVDLIKYDNYENMYDLELDDEEHVYYTNGILSHNTSVAAIYILWMATFQKDKLCVIASKAMAHATEIMGRIKFSYEELPNWLKAGCKFYNRTSIEFDNGSVIKSEATTEKTGRGGSPSILFIDEIAFVSKRIQDEMWASITPSLSTGGKFILTTTPNGDSDLFASLWRSSCAGLNSFVNKTVLYHRHPERGPGSGYYEEMVGKLGELKAKVELDCEFLSSDALLVSSLRLNEFRYSSVLFEDNGFKFWDELKGNPMYLVACDVATGRGADFSVIDIFTFPGLVQIGQYRSNDLNIPGLYGKLKWILEKLSKPIGNKRPEVMWTFERNSIGEAIAALYETDEEQPEFAELINDVPGKLGMATTNKSKVLACLQMKTLLEKIKNGLIINSEITIFELKNFIASGGSYAAKQGATDDAVMALVLIVRLIKYVASFDPEAHKLMYKYDENDYSSDNETADEMDEPMPILF